MAFLKSFSAFVRRVLQAAKKGGLSLADLKKLSNLLRRTGKRNAVLARGLLSALSAGGASERDIRKLAELLHLAEERIMRGEEPFNEIEKAHIARIFRSASLSQKAASWLTNHVDEFLASEIREQAIEREKKAVPKKKRRRAAL